MHLLHITGQTPNYLLRGHQSADQHCLLQRLFRFGYNNNKKKPTLVFHIPSSAWQSSSMFSNNIQSTETSVLRRSMFVWPVPRGSCHLSPACAQRHRSRDALGVWMERMPSGQIVQDPGSHTAYLISRGRVLQARLTPRESNGVGCGAEGTGGSTYQGAATWKLRARCFTTVNSEPVLQTVLL